MGWGYFHWHWAREEENGVGERGREWGRVIFTDTTFLAGREKKRRGRGYFHRHWAREEEEGLGSFSLTRLFWAGRERRRRGRGYLH